MRSRGDCPLFSTIQLVCPFPLVYIMLLACLTCRSRLERPNNGKAQYSGVGQNRKSTLLPLYKSPPFLRHSLIRYIEVPLPFDPYFSLQIGARASVGAVNLTGMAMMKIKNVQSVGTLWSTEFHHPIYRRNTVSPAYQFTRPSVHCPWGSEHLESYRACYE